MNKVKIYLAGSMFCEADRMYNAYLAEKLRERCGDKIDLYVPQENKAINDKTKCATSIDIFWGDYNRLQECDIFIARIDGDIIPSGSSSEIGVMSQRIQDWKNHKKGRCPVIVGLCTDSRNPRTTYLEAKNAIMANDDYESQYCYFNLFTVGCIKVNGNLTTSADEMIEVVDRYVTDYLYNEMFKEPIYNNQDAASDCSGQCKEINEKKNQGCPHNTVKTAKLLGIPIYNYCADCGRTFPLDKNQEDEIAEVKQLIKDAEEQIDKAWDNFFKVVVKR